MIDDLYELARSHGCDQTTAGQLRDLLKDDWSGVREHWVERLNDLWWCEGWPEAILPYLNPYTVGQMLLAAQRPALTVEEPYELARTLGCDEAVAATVRDIIAADTTGWREIWLERLNDPERWCRLVPGEVPAYLDPENLRRIIAGRERQLDPFSEDSIRIRAWLNAAAAGGEFVTTRIDTGEEVRRYTLPGTRRGAAPEN